VIGTDTDGIAIWVATTPVDMRKSFDGLMEVVRSFLGHDPLSGSMFVFRNRAGHMLKILWWDRDGLVISYKRLESGSIEIVKPADGEPTVEIDATQLAMLLAGVTLSSAKRRKRYAVVG